MNLQFKFKLKTYLYYLVFEPWTSKLSLPNFRTMAWILIVVALVFRSKSLLIISIIVGVIFYLVHEFKSGKYMYWYRQQKYKEQKDALRKIREEKADERTNMQTMQG